MTNLYRYQLGVTFYDNGTCGISIYCKAFEIQERTPCGAWIQKDVYQPFDKKTNAKWVSIGTRRAYAYLDKGDALNSLRARNNWHQIHLEQQLDRARMGGKFLTESWDQIVEILKTNKSLIANFRKNFNFESEQADVFQLGSIHGFS